MIFNNSVDCIIILFYSNIFQVVVLFSHIDTTPQIRPQNRVFSQLNLEIGRVQLISVSQTNTHTKDLHIQRGLVYINDCCILRALYTKGAVHYKCTTLCTTQKHINVPQKEDFCGVLYHKKKKSTTKRRSEFFVKISNWI